MKITVRLVEGSSLSRRSLLVKLLCENPGPGPVSVLDFGPAGLMLDDLDGGYHLSIRPLWRSPSRLVEAGESLSILWNIFDFLEPYHKLEPGRYNLTMRVLLAWRPTKVGPIQVLLEE